MDALVGELGTWLLVVGGGVLLLALAVATIVLLTFLARGTPLDRLRVLDARRTVGGAIEPSADGTGGDESPVGAAPPPTSSEQFCEVAKVLCGTALADGHDVRCFFSGDALYDRLFADVAAARHLVTWHVFWFKPGCLADRVAEVLTARARAGVRVLVLLDHYGSKGIGDDYVRSLREAGVEVAIFRPPRWNTLYKAQNRMHIRAVVIDGRTGYTGGFAIDDRWLGDGRHEDQWRDTSVRVEGAAVDQLQGAFVANWGEATSDLVLGDHVFALDGDRGGAGTTKAGLMYSAPSLGSTSAERFFVVSIASARERLWLTTAYFVPDRGLRRLLCEAAGRGVDVRILTPGRNTDRPSTWYAARAHYEELLAAGVRLHEYGPTMLHAKTLVVDGVWSMVGTLNFDNRSLVLNDEVALLAWDRGVGAELEAAFREDLRWAEELDLVEVRRRPRWPDRIKEWAAGRVNRLL